MQYIIRLSISLLVFFAPVYTASGQANVKADKLVFRDSIPAAAGYVNDYGLLYTTEQKNMLDSLIGDFEDSTTIQIVIITYTSAMLENEAVDSMTRRVANIWGVGQKDKNNGLAIGICKPCREMTIQTGAGIQKILSNEDLKNIIDNSFTPDFKKEDFFRGSLTGLRAVMAALGNR